MLYGIHPVEEAADAGKTFDKVWVQRGTKVEGSAVLLGKLRRLGAPVQYVPKAKLDRLTRKNHQGIVAFVSPIEFHKLDWLIPSIYEAGESPLIVVLDGVSDVRNFGAICRTAECAGAHGVVIPERGSASINADAIKTSAGSLMRLPVCRVPDLAQAVDLMKSSGMEAVSCHEGGEEVHHQADLSGPTALIMGAEDQGISRKLLDASTRSIRIPLHGATSSLNVSVATGIALFEIVRQREMAEAGE